MIDTLRLWMDDLVELHTVESKNAALRHHSEDVFKQSYQLIKDSAWPDINNVEEWDNLPLDIQQECLNVHGLDPKKFASTKLLNDSQKNTVLKDKNNVVVQIKKENYFSQSALIPSQDQQTVGLHNSDPIKAHDVCFMKNCHHFIEGKLYKCGVAALLPEFYQQFDMTVNSEEIEIMHSYQPGLSDFSDLELEKFLQDIKNPISQCRLCPENFNFQLINSRIQKMHFKRKIVSNLNTR
jgi:hypothetical protein